MTENRVKEKMMSYIRNKYNEEFTFIAFDNEEIWRRTNNYDIVVEPAAFPGEYVAVRWNKKTGEMSDGYLALKLNAEVEKEVSAVAYEVYGENKVFNNAQTNSINDYKESDMSVSDFLKLLPACA